MSNDSADRLRRFYDGASSAPDHLLAEWAATLRTEQRNNTTHGLAARIMRDFVLRQWLGQQQSPVTLSWIAEVFNDILDDHQDPMQALRLLPRRNRRPVSIRRPMNVARWVQQSILRGIPEAEANTLAAETFHIDVNTVRRHRRAMADWVAGMNPDTDWDAHFLSMKPPRPLPAARNDKK